MIFLRQSTASQEILLGYFVDSTDGNSEETGLSIANTDIKIWKSGATTLANKNSGGATHIANGIYYAVLDATDTDTLGSLKVLCHVSGALAVAVECVVLSAVVYDSLIASSDNLQIDVVQWLGTAVATPDTAGYVKATIKSGTGSGELSLSSGRAAADVAAISGDVTAADNAESFFDGTGYAGTGNTIPAVTTVNGLAANVVTAMSIASGSITAGKFASGAIDATALATDAVAEIADGVWDEIRAGHTTEGSFGQGFSAVVNGQAAAGTLSTTQMTTNLTEATNDHYNGRVIVWVSGVLAGQATAITDYDGATKKLTYTAITEAPTAGDKFVIV